MRQADLDRAVARATGETIATIKRLGFLLDDPVAETDELHPEVCDAVVIGWDMLQTQRYVGSNGRSRYEPAIP